MTHGFNPLSQQKLRIGMWLPRKDLWEALLSGGLDSRELHERSSILVSLYQQKHCQPGLKGAEMRSNKGRMSLRANP